MGREDGDGMTELDKQLTQIYETLRRENIRCTCIFACVVVIVGAAVGMILHYFPISHGEPITYTYTDAAGTTTSITQNGRQTITTVTDSDGRVVSTVITGRRNGGKSNVILQSSEPKEQREQRRTERKARREQRRSDRLIQRAERLEQRAKRLREQAEQ
ncbi:MAG: hypothetical protein FWH07_08080 [Oscillospiraceae bacterium]|nr:hypothetical protein [Oscillospiraceae bacterium]